MAVDVQTFTPGTSLWTKPANALWTEIWAIGGGGKGGNGAKGANGGNRYGGGGGGCGAWSRTFWPAADLPATLNVVCGVGGGTLGAQQRCILDTGTPAISTPAANNSLGMRFTPSVNGWITHIRYYRDTLFAHNLSIWDASGLRMGTALTDVASGSTGWREVPLATPLYVAATARITVSRTQDNQARHDGPAITTSAAANLGSLLGCYAAGADIYPNTDAGTAAAQNYNVDVVFQPELVPGDSYVGASQDAAWVYASGGGNGGDGTTAAGAGGAAGDRASSRRRGRQAPSRPHRVRRAAGRTGSGGGGGGVNSGNSGTRRRGGNQWASAGRAGGARGAAANPGGAGGAGTTFGVRRRLRRRWRGNASRRRRRRGAGGTPGGGGGGGGGVNGAPNGGGGGADWAVRAGLSSSRGWQPIPPSIGSSSMAPGPNRRRQVRA